MFPETDLLVAILLGAGFAGALILLANEIRGVPVDRPAPGWRAGLTRADVAALGGRLVLGVVAGTWVMIASGWPVAGLAIAALALLWPQLSGGARAEQARINRLAALVTWTESLQARMSTNLSLEQAIGIRTDEAPDLIRAPLQHLAGRLRNGIPLDVALHHLAADIDDPSADVVIIALAENVGRQAGSLRRELTLLAGSARAELDLRVEIHARRAGPRRELIVIVGVTLVTAVFLVAGSGDYLAPYDSAGGQVVLALVLGIFAAGFAWMRRLANERPRIRLLARPGQPPDPADTTLIASVLGLTTTATAPARPRNQGDGR